jgi:hypothetical protein
MISLLYNTETIQPPEDSFYLWLNELIKEYELNIKPDTLCIFGSLSKLPVDPLCNKFIVYEDWWVRKPEIIKSKIKSILGISKKINGRQCIILKIPKPIADTFLEENHMYGSTNSKIKYGLYYNNELIAVATFAGQRQFKTERSVELIRYCQKNGYTVVGGLGKILNKYKIEYNPGSIMTYIDPDWGQGNSFKKLGFKSIEFKDPIYFYIDKCENIRISERNFDDFNNIENYYKICNRGTIKMIKNWSDQ